MNYVKLAHIAKSKAALDDDAYYALLKSACNVETSKDITEAWQWNKLRSAFGKLGVKLPYDASSHKPLEKKCYALWCKLNEQGKVKDKSWKAMDAFRRKAIGDFDLMHTNQWMHFVEILKKWTERV